MCAISAVTTVLRVHFYFVWILEREREFRVGWAGPDGWMDRWNWSKK